MTMIHRRGWCDGTGGNFSCVQCRSPLELLMAPSGVDKGNVREDDLIVVDASAHVICGSGQASAETLLHLTIVEATGAGAVLHTHSQAATLLSMLWPQPEQDQPKQTGDAIAETSASFLVLENLEMLKGLRGIETHASRVRIPVLVNDQNMERLSGACRPFLAKAPHGLLIAGHGLYAWGMDLSEARRHLEILEFLLELRWRQMTLEDRGYRFKSTGLQRTDQEERDP